MSVSERAGDIVLFGTLRDPDLLEIVLGCVADAQPVALADHRVFAAAGETFPLLLPCAGAQAEGLGDAVGLLETGRQVDQILAVLVESFAGSG